MTMTVDQEVLNAAADDWESLEQIYRSICLEFSSEHYSPDDPNAFYWRESNRGISLAQIAESTLRLVSGGMLQARHEDGTMTTVVSGHDVWRCWFKISESGRQVLLDLVP